MKHIVHIAAVAALGLALAGGRLWAQPAPASKPPARGPAAKAPAAKAAPAKPPAAAPVNLSPAALALPTSPYRRLAPGVFESVDLDQQAPDVVRKADITELLEKDPSFDRAKDVSFRQDIWVLQFRFKPVRMIWADIPGDQGRMQREQVWYMVYTVTNPGKVLHPVEDADKTYKVEMVDKPIHFVPVFTLEVHNWLKDEAPGSAKVYSEKQIPLAVPAIRAREDKNRQFLNTEEMAAKKGIAVGETVWGIATWDNVDPRNVWFSVYIEGLTNAYRWKDDPAKYDDAIKGRARAPFRELYAKVLKLNFWRPGDEYSVKEAQVRCGVPGQPDYEWVWRRAFP